MILVDTCIWIDHLNLRNRTLEQLLLDSQVVTHNGVILELSLGTIANRSQFLQLLSGLGRLPDLSAQEISHLIEQRRLWGRGLAAVDVHLIGSAMVCDARVWTRDKRLNLACAELGISAF